VLGDDLALKRLEHIVHPLVRQAEERFLAEAQKKGAKVALLDIPLLYETAGDKRCDAVVVVSAPADMQRLRAFERPGMTAEKFDAILAKQTPDTEKRRRADFVVDTSKGLDAARAQVRDILKAIVKMPQRHR
jgi:dephospho-CoA kinase